MDRFTIPATMTRPLLSLLLLAVSVVSVMGEAGVVSTPQEQAQFLAGIPLPGNSPLHALQRIPQYRDHRKDLLEQWEFCRSLRYDPMSTWGREFLSPYPGTRGVLLYLFGGPDFLNAYAFFPDTRVMVLGGLEPVGEVPPPEALDPAALGTALQALRESLRTSLFCGYFITSEMKPQLAGGAFQGVLPVLYTELALTGNMIDSVRLARPFGSSGVEIIYHRPGGAAQTLWYFRADLSNGRECRNFLSWLGELGPGCSYLKAASYLLPLDSFSETRNFLTRTSDLILQDDSGLPFRAFQPGLWQIRLFGVYTDPLPVFKLRREPGLDAAYASPLRIAPLPFGAGYHVNASDANLLLATRSDQGITSQMPAAPPAVPAFSSPTPKPKRVRIRKALPVPIRRAIPVPTPRKSRNPETPVPQEAIPVLPAIPITTGSVIPTVAPYDTVPQTPVSTPEGKPID